MKSSPRKPPFTKTRELLAWLYADPHGQGISTRLAQKKFGAGVLVAQTRGLVRTEDGVLKLSPAGLRALARGAGGRE